MRQSVFSAYKAHWKAVCLFALFTAGVSFFAPLKTFQLKWMIDATSAQEAVFYIGIVFVITLVSFALETACRRTYTRIACRALDSVRTTVMDRVMHRPFSRAGQEKDATYLSMLTNDCRILFDDCYMSVFEIVFWGGIMVVAVMMFIYLEPLLLLVTLVVSIPPLVLPRLMNRWLSRTRTAWSSEMARYTQQLKELLGGFGVIRAFLCEAQFLDIHKRASGRAAQSEEAYQQGLNAVIMSTSLMSNLIFAVMLLAGIFMVYAGRISLGTMTTATNLINFVITPCHRIAQAYAKFKSTQTVREKIESVMNQPRGQEGTVSLEGGEVDICCRQVGFAYAGSAENVLRDVSLTVRPGEKAALIGESGCGKSTLARLLHQQDPGYTGSIRVCGQELRTLRREDLYARIGYMAQDTFLFDDTLRNNICLYLPYSEAEIGRAVELAGLRAFVEALPNGLDTVIEENGRNISGGQRQRIGIARLVIRRYGAVIADEVTANLDAETTEQIMDNLLGLPCTMVVITHDVSGGFMNRFDRVYRMELGGVCTEAHADA